MGKQRGVFCSADSGDAGWFCFVSVFLDTDFRLHRVELHAHCMASLVFISYLIYFPADTGI